MNAFLRTVLTLTLAALAAATTTTAAGADAKLQKFTVGYVNWIGYTGLFVAKDKGYFTEEGLDVETKLFSAPSDGVPPVMNGDLDIHLTTLDTVVKADEKDPGSVVVPFLIDASRGADAFLAKTEYASVADLKGKKVAATLGECNHLLLLKALEANGMKESDIQLVNMNPDDAGTAFASGGLDGAVTWEPWITKATSAGQGHVVYSTKDAAYVILDVAVLSPKHAKRELSEKFLRAFAKAHDFILANPKEAAEIAAKAFEQTPEETSAMLSKVKFFTKEENFAEVGTPEKPGPVIAATKDLIDFFVERNVMEKPISPESVYDLSYLK
ncbi:MAG TPA: ABC transporter substrate-binding protein [Candidatus Binatia bacterium]